MGTRERGNEPSGSIKGGEFLTTLEPVTCSRKILLYGVNK